MSPDINDVYHILRQQIAIVRTSSIDNSSKKNCKQELYNLKYWLVEEYSNLPVFDGEDKWEQDQIIKILKD